MGQTLTHGVYLPDEGERNCYAGLAANWQLLDGAVGTIAEHTSALAGKAPLVHTHTKSDITDFPVYGTTAGTICEGNDSRLSDARTPVAHTHVTADVTDFPDMTLYPYKLAYTTNGGNFPYINLADSDHIALGFNGITDTGIYKVRATADVPGTPNALTLDGILIVFNSDGSANVSSHRRCQQIFYQNSTTPKIFKRLGVFNTTSQTWNWDTYKWVEYANTGRDFIPNETNSLNIGSSSYQWNNLYAKNYYYNGTAWGLDKANVWSADNTFSITLKQVNSAITKGTNPQSDINAFNVYWGGAGVSSLTNALFTQRGVVYADGSTAYILYALENVSGGTHTSLSLKYDPNDTINKRYALVRGDFRPYYDNSFNLGTTTNKWKTLNGINPGALSLPKTDAMINISTSGFLFNGLEEFMPDVSGLFSSGIAQINGWLVARIKEGAGHYVFLNSNINTDNTGVIQSCFSPDVVTTLQFGLSCSVPVCTGHKPSIRWAKPNGGNAYIYFIPCLGNV